MAQLGNVRGGLIGGLTYCIPNYSEL